MNDMNTVIPNEVGIWIECCNPACKKWRYTIDIDDPLVVPKKWYCHMNSDQSINKCSAPEVLELEKDEIFIKSKFKAGCIVWAKVIGHPWSPAMVDFCPEYECYYWFDNVGSNVPTQYHVTFLNVSRATRAWIKAAFVKSFVGNEDPAFVLKARVRGKKLKPQRQTDIVKACETAKNALRLSISNRLKKYNFNSWKLAHRFQNESVIHSGKNPTCPSAGYGIQSISNNDTGPSNTKKVVAENSKPAEILAENHQLADTSRENLKIPTPLNTKKPCRAAKKELEKENDDPKQRLEQRKSFFAVPDDLLNDSVTSNDTTSTNTKKTNAQDLDDTRSINSMSLNDSMDTVLVTRRQFNDLRSAVGPVVDGVIVDKRLLNKEIPESVNEECEEIIPSLQHSRSSKFSFTKIRAKTKYDDVDEDEKSDEIVIDEFEAVPTSPVHSTASRLSLKLKSLNKERRRNLCDQACAGRKSASENLIRIEEKENFPQESKYLKTLSEFTPSKNDAPSSNQPRKSIARKPLPNWFSDVTKRRQAENKRFDKLLLKWSEKEDSKMYHEKMEKFVSEMSATDPLKQEDQPDIKPLTYFPQRQNYDHLLTSDEDSF